MENYRRSPVWKETRSLVLAVSLAADAFDRGGARLSGDIRQESVRLLLETIELCEDRAGSDGARNALNSLEHVLSESQEKGFLAKSMFTRLSKEIQHLRSTLDTSPPRGGSASGSVPPSTKLSFSSSTGVLS